MGNHGVVGPGGVQYMSAGTGVRHSEFNASNEDSLHLVQMWLLPGRKGLKPAYGQRDFTLEERRNKWLLVASGMPGDGASVPLSQQAAFRVTRLENSVLDYAFLAGRLGFLFIAEGGVAANGSRLEAGDAVRIGGLPSLSLSGSGEVLFWDVPPTIDVPV
jgi:quercetin 2,3-dioxygenase